MSSDEVPDRKRPVHPPGVEFRNRATIYFVTVCTRERIPLLANETTHTLLRAAWAEAGSFQVGRYVVMPDHIHLFCSPAEIRESSLKRWVIFWKTYISRHWPTNKEGDLWQRDYWDTQLRRGDSYSAKWEYVRSNPVRAGLASGPDEWPYQGEIHTLDWHD